MAKKIIRPKRVIVCFKCSKCSKKVEAQLSHLITLCMMCPKCREVYIDSYMNVTGVYLKEKR